MSKFRILSLITSAACILSACGAPVPNEEAKAPVAEDHGGDQHDAHDHDHVHSAPRGGTLIELGHHEANIEVIVSPETGELHLYFLDAHAEHPLRLSAPSLAVQIALEGADPIGLTLNAVESTLTGETIGDSSAFSAEAAELQGVHEFTLTIPRLEARGAVYEGVFAVIHAGH